MLGWEAALESADGNIIKITLYLIVHLPVSVQVRFQGLPLWKIAPPARFYGILGQTHMNGWSRVIASQNRGSTDYISPLRLGVLQWSRHLFNYLDK